MLWASDGNPAVDSQVSVIQIAMHGTDDSLMGECMNNTGQVGIQRMDTRTQLHMRWRRCLWLMQTGGSASKSTNYGL